MLLQADFSYNCNILIMQSHLIGQDEGEFNDSVVLTLNLTRDVV